MPERIARAKAYPFHVPQTSYLLAGGTARHLDPGEAFEDRHIRGRIPVIACGSNRSPDRLMEKYGANGDTIPVERARLAHFDVVFSAHISSYGSIPATLAASETTRVEVSVTWLTEAQLAIMHETELPYENYAYVRLDHVELALENGGDWSRRLGTAFAYQSSRGALMLDGRPAALQAVPAQRRIHPEMSQEEVQHAVHRRFGAEGAVDDFILENIIRFSSRRARIFELADDADPFGWPHVSVVES